MLNEMYGNAGYHVGEMKNADQRCKPDYEAQINRAKTQLKRVETFTNAIFEFTGPRSLSGQMAELVGELESKRRELVDTVDSLIKQQEEDKD